MKSHWLRAIFAFTWELDFSQTCDFLRMLMNHKNFDFKKIPDKNNAVISLKSPKTMFLGRFWPFLPDGFFFPKIQLCLTQLYTDFWHAKFQKKTMSQSQEHLWADGTTGRQIKFHSTLPATTRGTTTSLQQVTAGNTPNLVLKRILRYFLKVPPLKKILQF